MELVRTYRGRRSNWHVLLRELSTGQVETLCGWVLTKFKRGVEGERVIVGKFWPVCVLTCPNCREKRELLKKEIP